MYLKTAIILGISIQITSVIYLVLFNYGPSILLHAVNPCFSVFTVLYKTCVKNADSMCLIGSTSKMTTLVRRPTALSNLPPFSILSATQDLDKYQWTSQKLHKVASNHSHETR